MSAKSRAGLKAFIFLLLIAAGVAGWMYFSREVARVVVIGRGTVANVMPGTVAVVPEKIAPITSEAEGRIVEINLPPGDIKKEGDVVAKLDPTDVELEIAHAKSEYKTAQDNAEIAKTLSELNAKTAKENLDAAARSFAKNDLALLDYDQKKRAFEVAEQQRLREAASTAQSLETLKHTLELAERKKEKMTVKAPFDGLITEVFVNINSSITGKQPLGTIVSVTRIVKARISEENFPSVAEGQKAKVRFLGYGDHEFDATVSKKLPTAEPGTQRYTVYLKVDIPVDQLISDLTGEASITVDQHDNVVVVPRRAVKDGQVFVVAGGRVHARSVDLGYRNFVSAEVKKGLEPGEQVIVEDLDKFEDGDRVRVEPDK